MDIDKALHHMAVLGAGGKMGRGIALLLLQEMATRALKSSEPFTLTLVDKSQVALDHLDDYFLPQLEKYAERKGLSKDFPSKALSLVTRSTKTSEAKQAHLVFEAIIEDVNAKTTEFEELKGENGKTPFILTNTSSIPIKVLDEKAKLQQRIIGFHFYNPPPVQKLVELIPSEETNTELLQLAKDMGRVLKKILVHSKDVAGFIGNGHFVREILCACEQVHKLSQERSLEENVYLLNRITQDFLLRPMGIFQLLDYVGIDVAQKICRVMSTYIPSNEFNDKIIEDMVSRGLLGGQNPDGSQKPGFFRYENGRPKEIYSFSQQNYVPLEGSPGFAAIDQELGPLPHTHQPWKVLLKDEQRGEKLEAYFEELFKGETPGKAMAQCFLRKSRHIAESLVKQGVADKVEDVNTVLVNGFFHLYGPANNYYS